MGLTAAQRKLYAKANGFDNADAELMPNANDPISAMNAKANFSVQFLKLYFTQVVATGVYTKIADSALDADLQSSLPLYLFGATDYAAGYAALNGRFPNGNENWTLKEVGVWGKDVFYYFDPSDTAVTALLQKGDLIQVFRSALPGAGTETMALLIQRGKNQKMPSILSSISSGDFVINNIRLNQVDDTLIYSPQNQEDLQFFDLSIFGKSASDSLSTDSMISGFQYKQNIIDFTINRKITKEQAFAFNMVFESAQFSMAFSVSSIRK